MARTPKAQDTAAQSTNAATKSTTRGRKYKVNPTPRQRRVAKLVVDAAMGKFEAESNKDIIAAAGYGKGLQNTPQRVMNSDGVKEALEDYGFTPEGAKKVVESILYNRKAADKDRLKASEMVFKVHGTYAAEKHLSVNVNADVNTERLAELAQLMRQHLK